MFSSRGIIAAIASFSLSCHATNASASTFMLVGGATSAEEMCLSETAGSVRLGACSSAVAAADGRELWSFLSGGQLMNAASKQCAGPSGAGSSLAMSDCGSASPWKMLPNGQVQVGGSKCLSQTGGGAGAENVAMHAAVAATSSANAASHSAAAAVDGDDATFWASSPGEAGAVSLTLDLGESRSLDLMKISWEFPAQSFAVSASLDGQTWNEVFSTSVNVVGVSHIPLNIAAKSVRVEMTGKPVYGIKSIALIAPGLEAALDDCAAAASSKDARDKYFAVSVNHAEITASAALRAELPALAAAKASLSTALSAVAGAELSSCPSTSTLAASHNRRLALRQRVAASRVEGADSGFGEADVKMLLATARSTIVGVRAALS